MSKNDNPRPLLVTLIAVVYLLMALVFLAAAALSLGGIELEIDMSEELLSLFGGSSLILGLFLLFISIGFFRGWSIFWYLGVIATVISLLLSAATILSGSMGSVIPTLVLLIVLLYLFKRNVKDFFLG